MGCLFCLSSYLPSLLCIVGLRGWLFQELGVLVSIVKHHIREYLDEIFQLIRENWSSSFLVQIIALVEDISAELKEEFKVYLPDLIPPLLKVLHVDTTPRRQATQKVLHALEVFQSNLEDYLHLVVPAGMFSFVILSFAFFLFSSTFFTNMARTRTCTRTNAHVHHIFTRLRACTLMLCSVQL